MKTLQFRNEKDLCKWFEKNYKSLGFKKILTIRRNSYPDYKILSNDNKEIEVEIETLLSNFILHKHDINKVDLIICLKKDICLPIKTIELNEFIYKHDLTTIKIEDITWKRLNDLKERPDESFDYIINKILDEKKKNKKE